MEELELNDVRKFYVFTDQDTPWDLMELSVYLDTPDPSALVRNFYLALLLPSAIIKKAMELGLDIRRFFAEMYGIKICRDEH